MRAAGLESVVVLLFKTSVFVPCPGANTCDKGGSGNVGAGCVSVNYSEHLPSYTFNINVMFISGGRDFDSIQGRQPDRRHLSQCSKRKNRFLLCLYYICVTQLMNTRLEVTEKSQNWMLIKTCHNLGVQELSEPHNLCNPSRDLFSNPWNIIKF